MLNLAHAQTFLAVLDAGGFRAAARRLDLSPSTVVDHVDQLEAALAARLLVRRRGAVRATPQGEAFRPFARALVDTARRARELVAGGPLRIAAASNVGVYLLQAELAAFQAVDSAPVELWIGDNRTVGDRLESGGADVALMEWWDGRPGFAARPWRRERLVVIVPPGHPWAGRQSVTAEDLAGETLLGGETGTGTGTLLRRHLGPLADRLSTVDGFGSTEAVKRAVRAGRGVSLVIASSVADEAAAGHLACLDLAGVALVKEIQLVAPEPLPPTAPARRFLDHALARACS